MLFLFSLHVSECDVENHCEGVHSTLALIPLWDMFNHSPGPVSAVAVFWLFICLHLTSRED